MKQRFENPQNKLPSFFSEYDLQSNEIQDLISRNPAALSIKTIPIGVSSGQMTIREPGFGFVMYGFNTQDNSKYSEAYMGVALNSYGQDQTLIFPAKTGRGFRGSFAFLTLIWPQDPNNVANSAYFIIFKSKRLPWFGGSESL